MLWRWNKSQQRSTHSFRLETTMICRCFFLAVVPWRLVHFLRRTTHRFIAFFQPFDRSKRVSLDQPAIEIEDIACTEFISLYFSRYLNSFSFYRQRNLQKCLSIFCTLPLMLKPILTSWRDLCNLPIPFSWTLSAQDAFKLPQFSATRKLLFCAVTVILCSANLLAARLVSQRDALTDAKLIKQAK